MQTGAIHSAVRGGPAVAAPPSGTDFGDAGLMARLQALRPPKRSFMTKLGDWWSGRPSISAKSLGMAELIHARIESAKSGNPTTKADAKAKTLARAGLQQLVAQLDGEGYGGGRKALYARVEKLVDRHNYNDVSTHFQALSGTQALEAIQSYLDSTAARAGGEKQAELIYTALVAKTATLGETLLPEKYMKRLSAIEASAAAAAGEPEEPQTPEGKLTKLRALLNEALGDTRMSGTARSSVQAAIQARIEEARVGPRIAALQAVTFKTPAATIDANIAELIELKPAAQQRGLDSEWKSAMDLLQTASQGLRTIEFYDKLTDRDPKTQEMTRKPCEPLARMLRDGTVAEFRRVQDQIDTICAKADPEQHLDLLAALGVGITVSGNASASLIADLVAGKREAVDPIFQGAEWDALADALKKGGVLQREQAALSGADTDDARKKIHERFQKERFAVECQHQLRVLNTEINRLLAANGRPALLGDAGRTPTASEAAIKEIRGLPQGLEKSADLLLLNWIYYSSFDPKTSDIDQDKARRLWAAFGMGREVPDFEVVKQQLAKGFGSLRQVKRVDELIRTIAKELPAARAVAAASQAHDPMVSARGIIRDLHERVTGRSDADLDDTAGFDKRLREAVESAKKDAAAEQSALPRKIEERNGLFNALAGNKWKLQSGADPHLTQSEAAQLALLVECLGLVEQSEAAKSARDFASVKSFTEMLMARASDLKGFNALERRFQAGSEPPGYGALKNLVQDKPRLEKLLNVCRDVDRLKEQDARSGPKTTRLLEVMEAVTRIQILRQAVATGPRFSTKPEGNDSSAPTVAVLKGLHSMGLTLKAEELPAVRQHVLNVQSKMQEKDRDLPKLCERFDPADPKAKGWLGRAIPGHPDDPGSQGAIARLEGYRDAEAAKLHAANHRAVEERFLGLQPGQSFGIQFGQQGELSGGYMGVPGITLSLQLSAERSKGINVQRSDAGYELQVVGTQAAGLTGTLSILGDTVSAALGRAQQDSEGFSLSCADRDDALALVQALAGGRVIDKTLLQGFQVQALSRRAENTGAKLSAELGLSLGDNDLLKLEAQLCSERGETIETRRSPFQEQQLRTSRKTVLAQGSATALGDRYKKEADRGYEVSVSRSITRRGALLSGQQGLSIRARLVNDDVRASLLRAMPHLGDAGAVAELAHYEQQIKQLREGAEGDQTVEIELECVMTQDAVREANGLYRLAHASQDEGRTRAVSGAEGILQEPRSYSVAGVHLVVRSGTEVIDGETSYYRDLARVSAEERLAVPPPPGPQARQLSDHYRSVLGSSVALQAENGSAGQKPPTSLPAA